MKKPDKNKMGRIGKMLVLGTALLSMATPMAAFAKTDRVDTPGTWRKQGEKWQFVREYGAPEKGWLVYKNNWYYQSPVEELMETGWLNLQGKTYFLSTENNASFGHVVTGWQWIDGYCYYFEEADQADYGVLFTGGKTKDGYYVDANGRWLNGAGGEPVYISGKGLSAAVSDQQVAGVSRSIPSGNAGQVAGVSRSGGSSSGGSSSGGSVSRGGSSSSSGGSTSGSGSSSSSGNSTSGSTSGGNAGNTGANAGNTGDNAGNTGANAGGNNSGNNTGNTTDNTGNTGNTGNTASSSNLPKEEDGKPEEKPGTGDNGNTEEKPGTGESGKPEENPTPEQPEEKNVIKLVGEAKVNQDVKLYVSKDIMDSIAFVSVGFQPVLPESHRENEPSYSLDREKQILTLPKSLFKKSKTYDISIQAGGIQPFHDITVEVKDDVEVPFTAEKGEPEVLNKGILLGPTYAALNEEADLHAFRVTYVPGKGMPEKPWWTTRLKSVVVEKTLYERVNSEKEFLEKKDVYYIVPEDAEEGANTILLSDSAFEDKEKFDLMLESGNPLESVIWDMKG
ncbi:N-acetylmuramoyl-L-alanine amidase family protein [Oribacterium sinus]|uniref:N-acetylmuramoyl-L-alanine amidase family protein n=1 Tax=Oribacterium sinus TaxID=237576 RepID=UPI0028E37EF0|nr:hypothetical protein [Oribacterium sinus]